MAKEKIGSYFTRAKATLHRIADRLFLKESSFKQRFLVPVIVKVIYILLTILLLTYKEYVEGCTYGVQFNVWKELLATFVFLPAVYIHAKLPLTDSFSRLLMRFLLILYYIPLNSSFALNDTPFSFFWFSNIYFLLLMAAVYGFDALCRRWHAKHPPRLQKDPSFSLLNNRNINLFCAAICILFIIHKLSYNGFSLSLSLESSDVYGNRSSYQEYLDSIAGTLGAYALSILRSLATFVTPYYLLSALIRKKAVPLILSILCILSMFSVSSEKSRLFILAVVVAIYVFYRIKCLERFERVFDVIILALLSLCLVEIVLRGESIIYSLFLRREMYIPSWMNSLYYDFFSVNPNVFWTQDVFVLEELFSSITPYATSPLYVISAQYFNGLVPSPNTGLFAEAYMHFGFIGLIIYPVILTVLFKFFSKAVESYGKAICALLAIQLTLRLINVPITRTDTVLGIFLFVAMLWILPKLRLPKLKTKKAAPSNTEQ